MFKKLQNRNKLLYITGITTPMGNPVGSTNHKLIKAIFQDFLQNDRAFCPEQINLYSVYCIYSDYINGHNIFNNDFTLDLLKKDHVVLSGFTSVDYNERFKSTDLHQMCIDLYVKQGWNSNFLEKCTAKLSSICEVYSNYLSSLPYQRQTVAWILNWLLKVDITLIILHLNNLVDIEIFRQSKYVIDSDETNQVNKTIDNLILWTKLTS